MKEVRKFTGKQGLLQKTQDCYTKASHLHTFLKMSFLSWTAVHAPYFSTQVAKAEELLQVQGQSGDLVRTKPARAR